MAVAPGRLPDHRQENVCAFSVSPDHTTIFAASTAGPCGIRSGGVGESSILRSDDGGAHWTQSGAPPNNGLVGLAVSYLPGSNSPMLYVESPLVEQQGGRHQLQDRRQRVLCQR